MMNPQYPPPGQNNNAPSNPLYPPSSQEFNGLHNANYNDPQTKPFDQNDMAHKLQNMQINGPGFPSIPTSQLPPGQFPPGAFPPTSNFGQLPPGQRPPSRPPVSAAQFPPMGQMPPSSSPGPQFNQPPNQGPNQNNQFQPGPPTSMSMQRPPSQPTSQIQGSGGAMPPSSQSGLLSQSGGPPQGQPPKPGMPQMGPPQPQQGMPPQGMPPQQAPQQGMPPQPGLGPQPSVPSQPGMPSQQNIPPQPGVPSQQGIPPPGLPPQSQAGQMPQSRPGMPPGLGQMSQHQGAPQPRSGQMPGLPTQLSQPGFPAEIGQKPGQQPGFPGQQPGFPGQQPGFPSQQPGFSGQPPRPSQQPGFSGQPPTPGQPGQMPGQSHQFSGQPGQFPGQPGQLPGQPGQGPPQSLPSKPGSMLNQPGPMGPPQGLQQPGMMPPQPGQMPAQPGQMPPRPGQMPPQPGQMPPQSGQMPPQPGHMPPQPGQLPPQAGQLPPQPGQLPPQPGQMPPQPGQMPPQPGQMPPQPGQMPPQPGQMPPQPGQMSHPGMPPQPGMQQLHGMPHMPPPLAQQRQFPGMPPAPGGPGQNAGYPGMPPAQPGYQPQSGYPAQFQPPFPGQQPSYPSQMQPPQKKLDPDQMPSPIQVMADDQANRGGIFVTNEKGLVPPLVTTDFVVDDKGNASPRYMRSSMYTVPVTADLLKQTALPFCLVISPMAETVGTEAPPPLLDFAALTGSPSMGPVRCSRCKAYICPNMKFVDAGRHFHCAFCKATTEVPMEYTQYINSMQQYGRVPAELALGAYEILATKEYCRNNTLPNPPAIVFVIDVSYNSVKSGLLQTLCNNIMDIIEAMPKDEQTGKSWTRVGFITYSSTVHFYNIKGTLAQPQMLSVGDVGDMFVPLLEGFLVYPEESGPVLQALLQQLPQMFQDNKETEIILLPAVQAGYEALKAADTAGQLLVFHTSLPTYNAPGKLNNREDRKLLGTDKEKQILSPQTTAYNELGQLCSAAGVSVELFLCNHSYVDVATLGQLPRLTGGQIRKYTYFQGDVDGARLVWDAKRTAARSAAHDAVMRVRTSTGVRPTDFYGHMFMSNTTDVELAAVDCDKAIGVEIKHDDKLTAEEGVYIQAALLYTHRNGQRRLRILNLALNVAHQLADVYRAVDLDTVMNFLAKNAVWALRSEPPRAVRAALTARCCRSLAAYRRHCASPSSAGQLVLPESCKLLPLYTAALLRSDALGGADVSCDERSCACHRFLCGGVRATLAYTYPRLLPLHRAPHGPLRASIDKMHDDGLYLLENGVHMLIWVGSQASPGLIRDVFGVESAHQVDTQVTELPTLDTDASAAVRAIIDGAREMRGNAMRLTVMRQHDKLETVLRHFLVEDRGVDGSASYVDFLCHVHKEIRAML